MEHRASSLSVSAGPSLKSVPHGSGGPPSERARPTERPAPLCVAATRIVQTAVRPDVQLADLARLAARDPAFAIKVLAMVNSAAFGRGHRVTDLHQASSLLGIRGLRNLALGLIVSDMVPTGADGEVLFAISLRRAAAARLIAEAMGEKVADDAFTAGLFLEVALLSHARTDLPAAARLARMPAAHRPVVERAFGHGEEHPAAGAKLAAELGLPESVVEAIRHHHDREAPQDLIQKIAWAAEHAAAAWEGGDTRAIQVEAGAALSSAGLSATAIEGLMTRLPELVMSMAAALDREVVEQVALDQLVADAHSQLVEMNNGYAALVRRLETLLAEKDALAAELRRANADLANLAATDALTGLPNKRCLAQALARELALADRNRTKLALLVLDIDHFKKVNDTHGHQMGDRVLVLIGEILRAVVRASDTPARYGGEEFVVLLPGTNEAGALSVAERIRASLEASAIPAPTGPIRVTASIGLSVITGPGCMERGAKQNGTK